MTVTPENETRLSREKNQITNHRKILNGTDISRSSFFLLNKLNSQRRGFLFFHVVC